MYPIRIPNLVQRKLSAAIWRIPSSDSVHLTFDDGPSSYTGQLLDILDEHKIKAGFFLLGEQIDLFPELKDRISDEGHFIGNHGQEHLSGWKTDPKDYQRNVDLGRDKTQSKYFRPPYGKMTPAQWKEVSASNQIVMWDVMPGDFDQNISDSTVIRRSIEHSTSGSIIVLHDNEDVGLRILRILPRIIQGIREKGLDIEPLPFNSFTTEY